MACIVLQDKICITYVEEGKYCKPVNHLNWYEDCYDENVRAKFDKQGLDNL